MGDYLTDAYELDLGTDPICISGKYDEGLDILYDKLSLSFPEFLAKDGVTVEAAASSEEL